MHPLKLTICVFVALLLTACNPLYPSAPVTNFAVNNSTTTADINEQTAFELLLMALEQAKVTDLDCLQFRLESNNEPNAIALVWEFAAVEVHDVTCGGDPYIAHVRSRYQISADGSVMVYDAITAEYKPL